jgi:hypothetical protein
VWRENITSRGVTPVTFGKLVDSRHVFGVCALLKQLEASFRGGLEKLAEVWRESYIEVTHAQ